MLIRLETPSDVAAIFALTEAAFAPMAFSDGTESSVIDALRDAGDLTLSLVTEDAGKIVGHVAYSAATINGQHNGWFGLGPISVTVERQKQRIGSALVAEGTIRLRGLGANGIALIGNPKVYGPMGFCAEGLTYRDLPPTIVQSMPLAGDAPSGALLFAPALEA